MLAPCSSRVSGGNEPIDLFDRPLEDTVRLTSRAFSCGPLSPTMPSSDSPAASSSLSCLSPFLFLSLSLHLVFIQPSPGPRLPSAAPPYSLPASPSSPSAAAAKLLVTKVRGRDTALSSMWIAWKFDPICCRWTVDWPCFYTAPALCCRPPRLQSSISKRSATSRSRRISRSLCEPQ